MIESLCSNILSKCDPKSTSAFISKTNLKNRIYLIDTEGPKLIAWNLSSAANDGKSLSYWDFSDYQHSFLSGTDIYGPRPLQIYPALYPVGKDRFAVAIVNSVNEAYSGGGAEFNIADFVVLEDEQDESENIDQHQALYSSVPFSCSKMIRACFSEHDRKTLRSCHDVFEGHLSIQYPPLGQPGSLWKFIWNESIRPSNAKEEETHINFSMPRNRGMTKWNKLPRNVSFCGGAAVF